MIVVSNILSFPVPATPPGTPLIGWDDAVTYSNISATSTLSGYPANNMALPMTHQRWKASAAGLVTITVNPDPNKLIDYVAVAGHNFGTAGIQVSAFSGVLDSTTVALLHMDGVDTSTIFKDDSGLRTWTPSGSVQISTAAFKFNGASALFSGGYISTPDSPDFYLDTSNFTIDGWFNCTAAGGTARAILGQQNSGGTAASLSVRIYRNTSNQITAECASGSSIIGSCVGAAQFTNSLNTGFHHFAYTRNGTLFTLYIDGAVVSTASSGLSINDSTEIFAVGQIGANTTLGQWAGNLDEVRIDNGLIRWNTAFTPPVFPASATVLSQMVATPDNAPLLINFPPTTASSFSLRLAAGSAPAEAAVVYLGKLLVMEKGIKIDTTHVPLPYGRKAKVVTGFSEVGNFLGRIVTQSSRQSKANFSYVTPDWYRANMDPFIAVSKTKPFFFVWNPLEYPLETGYAWMTNDPEPATDPITRRVHVDLEFTGIAS